MNSDRIELCVPAQRRMLLVIRMTTVGVISRAGLTLDEVDDVKMAIDEACSLIMSRETGFATLAVAYEYGDGLIRILIEGRNASKAAKPSADEDMQDVMRCILEAMVDEVRLSTGEDGSINSVCLMKKIPERQGTIL